VIAAGHPDGVVEDGPLDAGARVDDDAVVLLDAVRDQSLRDRDDLVDELTGRPVDETISHPDRATIGCSGCCSTAAHNEAGEVLVEGDLDLSRAGVLLHLALPQPQWDLPPPDRIPRAARRGLVRHGRC
jgi:hypothetical protein